ncbi:MAG: HlyC/CorC family transporter [Hyphomicrobiaceae bacterium]
MPVDILLTVGAVLFLLVASAFFSGSETALTASSRARMHTLALEGDARAAVVNKLMETPERVIGTVLLGNNLVNILATSLTTSLLIRLFGEVGVAYATLLITALVVIFSEVLPKTYAIAFADRVSLAVSPIMLALVKILRPLTRATEVIVRQILRLTPTRLDDDANILAHKEIRGTIELQSKEGAVARRDAEMLGGVLDLRELQVLDIMVHRTNMATIDIGEPPGKIIDAVLASQYTRMPVWRDEPDNFVGILHSKDLLLALRDAGWSPDRIDIAKLLSPPWFVPDTTSVNEQLSQFLKRKSQLALVVDEYGEVRGLVTLEDILEEIVGQIADEHDVGEVRIRPQSDGSVLVEGTLPIRDLNRETGWSLPEEIATTVAGLVMHEAQTIPEAGQVFTFHGFRFEIVRKTRNRITAVRIRPVPPPAA